MAGLGADPLDEFESVHARHVQVGDHGAHGAIRAGQQAQSVLGRRQDGHGDVRYREECHFQGGGAGGGIFDYKDSIARHVPSPLNVICTFSPIFASETVGRL